jgi:hypothetical protein
MTQPLSPTAQAVLDAVFNDVWGLLPTDVPRLSNEVKKYAAAVIKALVEHTLPEEDCPFTGPADQIAWSVRYGLRAAQLAVADELEAAS